MATTLVPLGATVLSLCAMEYGVLGISHGAWGAVYQPWSAGCCVTAVERGVLCISENACAWSLLSSKLFYFEVFLFCFS